MTTKEVDVSTKILNCKLTDEEKETLAERGYKMQTIMNEGSCSLVYLSEYQGTFTDENAVQRQVSLKLACKVMETEQAPKDFVHKFLLRELDIISQISHPHIIHTHSILHLNTKILMFMRNAEYGNLCEYITNYGGLREKQARIWFRQLAVAIGYLHTIHVVHRDIKCENILITCSFNVKVCDFGFARFCADNKGKPVFSTTFCGSIAYAAPELIKGTPYVPMFSDVWSLGVVLYIMLNGAMPFRTDALGKLWETQITKDYRFKRAIIPRTTKEVINLISRMLEPNWIDRASIDEVLNCEWFGLEPSILHYTPMEEAALVKLNDIQPKRIVLYIMLNGIMPFKTDNLGKLWSTQINKDYRFRTSVIPRTSREVIDLVSSMLEPNWFERTTLEEVLNSEWFSLEPSLRQYTPKEEEALQRARIFTPENNAKFIKKIMRSNRAKKTIEAISKEAIQEPSDEMDEAAKKLNVPKHLQKLDEAALLKQANQEQNPLAHKVTERRGSQEGRRPSIEGRRPSIEGRRPSIEGRRSSFEGRRASVDAALDASIAERAETSKEANTKDSRKRENNQ